MDLVEITINIILSSVSLAALLIILWDHIIDDRKLTIRVQGYYENLENLIFTYLERYYYFIAPKDKNNFQKKYDLLVRKYIYYRTLICGEMSEYDKYLGLTRIIVDETTSPTKKFLVRILSEGGYEVEIKIKKTSNLTLSYSDSIKISSGHKLNEKDIGLINNFYDSIRKFWENNYRKLLIRPKLKPKLNFKNLSGFQNPIIKGLIVKNRDELNN